MTPRDLLEIAGSNLLRMKLRTSLSVAGVVIAVAAFVAMLSFGAGNQQLIAEQYDRFGLFFTMQVYPKRDNDTTRARLLDDQALEQLALLPGVRFAYPLDAFEVQVRLGDSTTSSQAQGISTQARSTLLFTSLRAGEPLSSDSAPEALITMGLLRDLGLDDADSAVGRPLEVTVNLSRLDSAMVRVFQDREGDLRERFRDIRYDSLVYRPYLTRTMQTELASALERFLDGLTNGRVRVTDTLTIRGVLAGRERVGRRIAKPLVMPQARARALTAGGLSDNPADLFAAMSQGRLPLGLNDDDRQYPRVTLNLERDASYEIVKDSVDALGFRSFSYAEQFDEIRQFFVYFDLALGLIGMIALLTASLGIANTLIMAIMERRREIGVLKSLGADDRDIRLLFLFESGTIGAAGAVLGILLGWLISRLGSLIARTVMENKGFDPVELFALPWWLIGAALVIGVTVSVVAGLYPAARAARVDPVSALRSE